MNVAMAQRLTTASPVKVSSFWQRRRIDIILLATVVNFLWLWQDGASTRSYNLYYAATVRSMLTSWHAFFFASFDPAGFVTIDKPPLGFWVQAASAKLFGFGALSVLLPQALAGVFSVVLLGHLVGRVWGSLSGTLAALILALTPISVAVNRSNTVDSLLILTLLLAAWAISYAAETGRLRPLLLCAVFIGLGFNIKGMQSFIIVPVFVLFFVPASPLAGRTRLLHLGIATVVLLVVSLVWIVAVDTTPSTQRPFVGSSSHNTEMDLALGFNGFSRLTYRNSSVQQIGFGPGAPGPARLLNRQLGGQAGWLLPLAVLGLLTAGWNWQDTAGEPGDTRFTRVKPRVITRAINLPTRLHRGSPAASWHPRLPPSRQRQSLVLWGGWFLIMLVLLNGMTFFHPHYLAMLAPAISALAGIGYATLLQRFEYPSWQRWWLLFGLIGTALVQISLMASFPMLNRWLIPCVACLVAASIAFWVAACLVVQPQARRYATIASTTGLPALLIAPAIWVAVTIWHPGNGDVPYAGPDLLANTLPGDMDAATVSRLMGYVQAHRQNARYILATPSAIVAAPLIVATGQPVMAFGGYLGKEQIVTPGDIRDLTAKGEVRFFLMPPTFSAAPQRESGVEHWIRTRCVVVQATLWQPAPGFGPEGPRLYDCSKPRRESVLSGGISADH